MGPQVNTERSNVNAFQIMAEAIDNCSLVISELYYLENKLIGEQNPTEVVNSPKMATLPPAAILKDGPAKLDFNSSEIHSMVEKIEDILICNKGPMVACGLGENKAERKPSRPEELGFAINMFGEAVLSLRRFADQLDFKPKEETISEKASSRSFEQEPLVRLLTLGAEELTSKVAMGLRIITDIKQALLGIVPPTAEGGCCA